MIEHSGSGPGAGKCMRTEEMGAYLSGGMEGAAAFEFRRHTDNCAVCSQELGSLRVVLDALAALPSDFSLDDSDVPVQLGDRLLARAASEQRRRRLLRAVGSVAAATILAVGAVTVGRHSITPPSLSGERIVLAAGIPGSSAVAWVSERPSGTYVQLTATGLPKGRYRMWFKLADGTRIPMGSFRGLGGSEVLRCPGSSDQARRDIVGVGASDEHGTDVLTASMRTQGPIQSYSP